LQFHVYGLWFMVDGWIVTLPRHRLGSGVWSSVACLEVSVLVVYRCMVVRVYSLRLLGGRDFRGLGLVWV